MGAPRHAGLTFTLCAAMMAGMALPLSASAATQVGSTAFAPSDSCGEATLLQYQSSGSSYAAPARGVITSWALRTGAAAPLYKFKVGRPLGGNQFFIVGDSAPVIQTSGTTQTYPARIPVEAGDVIGFWQSDTGGCDSNAGGHFYGGTGGDIAPGTSTGLALGQPGQLPVAATLEPDADNDGYGDETQDQCPGEDLAQEPPCDRIAPETTITKGPKDKTKKKQATFEFSGTDARAVAGFECSPDGGPYAPCTSPHTVKVKKGKHTFSVRASDAGGNVDGSPATDDWKVKRRKKK